MSRQHPLKQTKKLEIPLHPLYLAVAVLLLAVLTTFLWTTTTLAKYSTSTTGSDEARVARFDVQVEPKDNQETTFYLALPNTGLDGTDGEEKLKDCTTNTASYSFTVTSNSEVTVTYDVVVKLPDALIDDDITVTLKEDGQPTVKPTTTDTDRKTFTFSGVGTFQAGMEQQDDWTLTFTVGDNAVAGGTWDGIKIEVYAAQVD